MGINAAEADARRAVLAAPRLAAEENRAWQDVRKSDHIEVYEAFLEDWPRGAHATEARTKLDAMWRTDQGAFVRAQRSGSPAELQAFVLAWPRSTYATDARRELDLIRARDDDAWRRALADNSVSAFDFYLSSQPYGAWRVEANRSIESLRERDYDAWRYAAAMDQVWAYENYRSMYPWGGWYDTAFYRIDWIRGGRYDNNWNSSWNRGWDRGWRWGDGRDRDRDDHNNGGGRDRDDKNTYPRCSAARTTTSPTRRKVALLRRPRRTQRPRAPTGTIRRRLHPLRRRNRPRRSLLLLLQHRRLRPHRPRATIVVKLSAKSRSLRDGPNRAILPWIRFRIVVRNRDGHGLLLFHCEDHVPRPTSPQGRGECGRRFPDSGAPKKAGGIIR